MVLIQLLHKFRPQTLHQVSVALRYLLAHLTPIRIYKLVFPDGLSTYATPGGSRIPSPQGSTTDLRALNLKPQRSLFSRFSGSFLGFTAPTKSEEPLDGPIEETIAAGAAFGKGTCRTSHLITEI